jgi:hypothetical protein
VDLLGKVQGTGTLPAAFCALLLCTCQRWQAVTAKLIAAIEGSGMLMAPDLDKLAESFLNEDVTVRYSLAWLNPEWLTPEWLKDLANETGMASVAEDATGSDRRRIEPPLRRWAASEALRKELQRLDELLATANAPPPQACRRHRGGATAAIGAAGVAVGSGPRPPGCPWVALRAGRPRVGPPARPVRSRRDGEEVEAGPVAATGLIG